MNQKRFILILALYTIGNVIAVTFTNFYLWQKTTAFHAVLVYNTMVFLAMGIGGLYSGVLAEKKGNLFTYKLSMVLYAVQLLLLIFLADGILAFIPLVGAISGLAIGMQSFSYNTVSQKITTVSSRERFFGTKTAVVNVATFLAIPGIAALIQISGSYLLLFVLAIVLFLLVIVFMNKLQLADTPGIFEWSSIKGAIIQNKDIQSFFVVRFLYGIQDGLFWVALGIITLEFIGSLSAWGFFSACLTLLSIVIAYIYGQVATPKNGNVIAVFATFLFASVTIVLATNWNLWAFIVYQFMLVILNVTMAIDFDGFLGDILDQDKEISHLRSEYNATGETVTSVGRLLPVVILLILNVTELNNLYLRVAFLLVAPIPFFIMNILSRTKFLQVAQREL